MLLIASQVTLIPGDGIGQEITDSVKEIFEYVNAPIEWEQYNVSGMSSEGEDLFKAALESLRRNRVGLKGTRFSLSSTGERISDSLRYSLHPHLADRSRIMERRDASAARHLRLSRALQVAPRIPHPPQQRRLCHHP